MQSSNSKWIVGIVVVVIIIIVVVLLLIGGKPEIPVQPEVATTTPIHTVIGTSVEGRAIDAYSYGNGPTRLLFIGGIHGGYEWNSVALAYNLMDYLEANPNQVPANETVVVIPSINPDAVFKVVGKEGRFSGNDVATSTQILESARFNANGVDLNRNFDCEWQPKSTWRSKTVSAGSSAFSEPEAAALRDFVTNSRPAAVIFWHSQSNAVYASHCGKSGILAGTRALMNTYATASGYPSSDTFDAYAITGAADDWLSAIGIPAVSVELSTHEAIEWDKNLKGIKAVIEYYGKDDSKE